MKNILKNTFYFILLCGLPTLIAAQEDSTLIENSLLSMLEVDEGQVYYVNGAFESNRVINLHSIEQTAEGVLDVKISHRFGFINRGIYNLFGLDNSTIRIGGDYGLTDNIQLGIGRSSFDKVYDGYIKWRFLRQKQGAEYSPVTIALLASTAIETINWAQPDRENYFTSRLFYTFQVIIGRKFNRNFSLQLSPTLVHRNFVATREESNDVYALGIGLRQRITSMISLNLEYIPIIPDFNDSRMPIADRFTSSISIGIDIETGGHVFQLHFTNSTSMIEKGFIAETTGRWTDLGVHFGFNISRVFTLYRPADKY